MVGLNQRKSFSFRLIVGVVNLCFIASFLVPARALAQSPADLGMPKPGTMLNLTSSFVPVIAKGLHVHPENPILFDFLIDTGNSGLDVRAGHAQPLRAESEKLIKYFLASLTIPENDLWVNLSPYEKDRIIPDQLGQTEMGRDMLAQDYVLKQLTASLIYPEKDLGKEFWNRVYAKAQQVYGSSQVPVNTFNKVWIVADKAKVYVHDNTAFVVASHLKVMLEEDYLSMEKHNNPLLFPNASVGNLEYAIPGSPTKTFGDDKQAHSIGSQIIREIVLPELDKEINTGKNFANLRQIFHSMILAAWYKKNLKEALLNQVYSNKDKINGVDVSDKTIKEQIYQEYLKAYKKGVFNYIKEDVQSGQAIPRKYFSGGLEVHPDPKIVPITDPDAAMFARHSVDGAMIFVTTIMNRSDQENGVQKQKLILENIQQVTGVSDGAMSSVSPVLKVTSLFKGIDQQTRKRFDTTLSDTSIATLAFAVEQNSSDEGLDKKRDEVVGVFDQLRQKMKKDFLMISDTSLATLVLAMMNPEKISLDDKTNEMIHLFKTFNREALRKSYIPSDTTVATLVLASVMALSKEGNVDQIIALFKRLDQEFSGGYNETLSSEALATMVLSVVANRLSSEIFNSHISEDIDLFEEIKKDFREKHSRDLTDSSVAWMVLAIQMDRSRDSLDQKKTRVEELYRDILDQEVRRILSQDSVSMMVLAAVAGKSDAAMNITEDVSASLKHDFHGKTILFVDHSDLKETYQRYDQVNNSKSRFVYNFRNLEEELSHKNKPDAIVIGSGFYREDTATLRNIVNTIQRLSPNTLIVGFSPTSVGRETHEAILSGFEIESTRGIADLFIWLDTKMKDKAAVSSVAKSPELIQGGIDLNAKNLLMDVDGQTISLKFDAAMLAQFQKGNFSGVHPVIIKIAPIPSILPMMGFVSRKEDEILAKL
ncbi:MAG: hypothetical protein HQL15_03925 [Candidatus Omnitrophica bacterium]|nr:hypothetical protein [Candidatus Omnitrophota bacterium]